MSCTAGRFFTTEPPGKPKSLGGFSKHLGSSPAAAAVVQGPGVGPRDSPVTWMGSRVRTLAWTNHGRTETDFPQPDNRPL